MTSALFPGTGLQTTLSDCSAVFFTYYCDDADFLDHSVFGYTTLGFPPGPQIDSLFLSFNIDGNIGDPSDDYFGYIDGNSLSYFYNADTLEMNTSGLFPPVVGFDLHTGIRDSFGIYQLVNSVIPIYPVNSNVPVVISYPKLPHEYYRYITGYWRDGQPITVGGNGYGGNMVADYIYNGVPGIPGEWSELEAQNQPGDRRILVSSGPGTGSGYQQQVLFSMNFVSGENSLSQQWESLRQNSVHAGNFFYADYFPPAINPYDTLPCFSGTTGIPTLQKLTVKIFPNPVSDVLQVDAGDFELQEIVLVDMLGRPFFSKQNYSPGSTTTSLTTAAFPPGIYFLNGKLKGGEHFTHRIVKL
jgi:hypothetical protein